MPPKKRKTSKEIKNQTAPSSSTCSLEDPLNAKRGLLPLPVEAHSEILDNFLPVVRSQTQVPTNNPVLSRVYLQRTDVLRALSQVCVSYRRHFLPLLWQTLNLCVGAANDSAFYKHVGDTLTRKCSGLSKKSELSSLIQTVNVVLTRYQAATLIPTFSTFLQSLPNLHTLHVLHAHTQMTTALKNGFETVTLPNVKTLIVPGYCHEILKRCPRVTTIWCIEEDGSKLVSVIAKHCKEVEEMRGFSASDTLLKRIIKAAPNLRTFEVPAVTSEDNIKRLSGLKNLHTLIIKTSMQKLHEEHGSQLQTSIKHAKSLFSDLPPTKQRRFIRVWHEYSTYFYGAEKQIVPLGYFTEVDLD